MAENLSDDSHSDDDDVPSLSDPPTVADLFEILEPLVRLQQFAIFLPGITDSTIKRIEKERPQDIEMQKFDIFSEWLRIDPVPSWEKVIVALLKAKENTLASKIGQLIGMPTLTYGKHNITSRIKGYIYTFSYHLDLIQKNEGIRNTLEFEDSEREEKVREELRSLIGNFAIIFQDVQNEVDKKVKKRKKILTDMKRYLLSFVDVNLIEVQNVDELFYKIDPYYDFLDCELIKNLSERYTTPDISQRVKIHSKAAMGFRMSGPVKALREGLLGVCVPHIKDGKEVIPNVIVKLNEVWDAGTINALYKLIEHLLPDPKENKRSLLKHINIFTGSVNIC